MQGPKKQEKSPELTLSILNKKLIHFSVNGYRPGILELLKQGADPNARDDSPGFEGETPLIKAVVNNDLAVARLLLKNKARINQANDRGESPLLVAAFLGHYEMTRLLVRSGARINQKSKRGISPLLTAADSGQTEVVNYLLKNGAQPDTLPSGYNILMAASKDSPGLLKSLLKKGLDPDLPDKLGRTALMEAVCAANPESVRILYGFGADLFHKDHKKRGIVDYLFLCNHYGEKVGHKNKILKFLLAKKPLLANQLLKNNVFGAFIREEAAVCKKEEFNWVKTFVDLAPAEVLNSIDKDGFSALDKLYFSEPGKNSHYKSNQYKKSQCLLPYLEKKGAKAPHKVLIQDLVLLTDDLFAVRNNTIPPSLHDQFNRLYKKYGKGPLLKVAGFLPKGDLFYELLAEKNIFPPTAFHRPGYLRYLYESGKENVIINFYIKNFRLSQQTFDFKHIKPILMLAGGKKTLKTMIRYRDPYLLESLGYLLWLRVYKYSNGKDKNNLALEKLKMLVQYGIENKVSVVWSYSFLSVLQDQPWYWSLYEKNALYNKEGPEGDNILHNIVERRYQKENFAPMEAQDMKLFLKILSKGVDVNKSNYAGDTPLIIAARNGFYTAVKALTDHGANINPKNNSSENALYVAVLNRHTSIVHLLLSKGADPGILNFFKEIKKAKAITDPVLERYQLYYSEDLQDYAQDSGYLLKPGGRRIGMQNFATNDCRVYYAVDKQKVKMLKGLLELGFSPNCLQVYNTNGFYYIGGTPLEAAIFSFEPKTVRLLLENGADPFYRNRWGKGYLDLNSENYKSSLKLIREAMDRIHKKKGASNVKK